MHRHFFLLLISTLFFLQPCLHSHIVNVTSQDDFGKLIKNNNIVVVKCYTTRCGACQAIKESFNALSQDPSIGNSLLAQVDIDTLEKIRDKYNIEYVPEFLFFKSGKVIKRKHLNSINTLKEEIIQQLNILQKIDPSDIQEQEVPQSSPLKTNILARLIELIILPINLIMHIIEKIISFIKGWFV